ncbi:energy transducer TonB [Propionivibrio sp.]|uniref:energy transducer TonB n=1 Tax=Propionivibrio sp. TaxID=2212460 RepID=UPI003BF2B5D6
MEIAAHLPPPEKSNVTALVLSASVHLLLIAALFFGVQWKSQAPSSVEVEVWRAAPAVVAPAAKPEPRPEPPPEPKVEPKPTPKPVPKAEPAPVIKPDIALKDEKKPKKEEPKKPEPKKEEPKKPEPKKEEPKKPEPDRRQSMLDEAERDLKQSQRQKASQNQRASAETELNQRKAEQASAAKKLGSDAYMNAINGKIRGNIVLPPGIQGNPEATFKVVQLPSGEVLSVKLGKSSGNPTLDAAIERAIWKSSPLPKPAQPELFDRELSIHYRPIAE